MAQGTIKKSSKPFSASSSTKRSAMPSSFRIPSLPAKYHRLWHVWLIDGFLISYYNISIANKAPRISSKSSVLKKGRRTIAPKKAVLVKARGITKVS